MLKKTFDNPSLAGNNLLKWAKDANAAKCANCLSVCCLMPLTGISYVTVEEQDNTVSAASKFFTRDFVIMNGFFKEEGARICPLAVNGRCLIYDQRPFICHLFEMCVWRDKLTISVEDPEIINISKLETIKKEVRYI